MQTKIPRFHDAHRGSKQRECQSGETHTGWSKPAWVGCRRRLTLVSLAVGTGFVGLELEQILDCLLVLGGLARGYTSRHNP